jgi:TonB-linked SusC/RagA family outer membrane protein
VGYHKEEIEVGNRSVIDLVMNPDITALSEVVVVGYGTQEKRDVTAAISSLSAEKIQAVAVGNPLQAMQGQIAGVDVVAQGGRPGQNSNVQIRGRRSIQASNDPLYVIDGVPMPMTGGSGTLFDINPQDIESIEVLKDAAATAIYGSRGANGVILVTTKRGSTGKTTVAYDGYYGISQVTRMIDMMNGEEFAAMKRESRRWDPATKKVLWNGVIPDDAVVFNDIVELNSIANGLSTDYPELVLGDGYQMNHQLSLTGGNQKTQFNLSAGYFDEQGLIENQDYKRYTLRSNVDHSAGIVKVGISSLLSYSVQNWGSNATLGEAYLNNPLGIPYDSSGNLIFLPTNDGIRTNPLNELVPGAYEDQRKFTRIFSSLYAEVQLAKGLKFKTLFGPDMRFRNQGIFRGSLTNARRGGPPSARLANDNVFGYTWENLLTYDKTFGVHELKFTALQSIQASRRERNGTNVTGLAYESGSYWNQGTATTVDGQSSNLNDLYQNGIFSRLEERSLASFMGRVNYELMGKYLFQATLRADGASVLAEGNKWAYFPGVSMGWRIVDESFMNSVNFVDELKLRASYGRVGNASVDPYQTAGRLQKRTYAWHDTPAFGWGLWEIPNPDKTWEISSTVDVGLDFGFFNSRVYGSFDYYVTNTTDLLLNRALPYTSGYDRISTNIGETRTAGVELALGAVVLDPGKGFGWNVDFNITSYKEEILDVSLRDAEGNIVDDIGNSWFIGQPIRVFFDYKKIGIWQADEVDLALQMENKVPGEIKLADVVGVDGDGNITDELDGIITPDDRVIIGNDVPDVYGGITNRFEFKGFDLSIFFYYKLGHMIRSDFHAGNNNLFGRYNNMNVDYWTIDNPTNENPRPNQNQEFPRDSDTRRYFDGSYVKLRNVTLGYNFARNMTESIGISNLRLYVSAQNPWFWAKYDTFDPENSNELNNSDVPSSKLYLVGLNFSF